MVKPPAAFIYRFSSPADASRGIPDGPQSNVCVLVGRNLPKMAIGRGASKAAGYTMEACTYLAFSHAVDAMEQSRSSGHIHFRLLHILELSREQGSEVRMRHASLL